MLTEFNQSTVANMTAALEYICKKIPTDLDSNATRKLIADELIAAARRGSHTSAACGDLGSVERPGLVVMRVGDLKCEFD
jgi:hypothetical protein